MEFVPPLGTGNNGLLNKAIVTLGLCDTADPRPG